MSKIRSTIFGLTAAVLTLYNISTAQHNKNSQERFPVLIDSDTLFYIHSGIGTFSTHERAEAINEKLLGLAENDTLDYDSLVVLDRIDYLILQIDNTQVMAVTKYDAFTADTTREALADNYRVLISEKLKETREAYSTTNLINKLLLNLLYIALLSLFVWLSTIIFPWLYKIIERLDKQKIKILEYDKSKFIKASTIVKALLVFIKGLRLALALFIIYLFITETLQLWPYTRKWDLQPVIKGLALLVFYTSAFLVIFKSINSLVEFLNKKYREWKEVKIKSIKFKSIEILSADRAVEMLSLFNKVLRLALQATLTYSFITIIFSLFSFSETWADKLLTYVLNPLLSVWTSLIEFLPNLFFIIVLVFVFKYIINGVKFFFLEIDSGKLEFPSFHRDWAMPTFKIVRFMILVLAAIVIFPYLPGSNSPFFQGISVFLGILFSLGSSSAIANMVAGIVLTYMRPFKIGDRVKIADTMGDVIEKTLLVTRIRTVKNVDITIPNAMVLGSHIINYSSSSSERGLILHTNVTIGYDVPWKKVHELLVSAASETESVLQDPKPFVLQTSLDDFYVSYELNVYTNNPQTMSKVYSELHSKIQDKFNEAGVEIMSPHYGAIRDGNQTTIPKDYLPGEYNPPSFRLFGHDLFGGGPKKNK